MSEIRGSRRHRGRTERSVRNTELELQDRDHWLLNGIGRLRFATTSQVIRLGFAKTRACASKRLRRLFDAGLVRVWMRSLESENIYSLTSAGRSILRAAGDETEFLVPRGLDRELDHTIAINDVRIALATSLPTIGAELQGWLSDWDLRPRGSSCTIPDARFIVRWSSGFEMPFILEIEHNTKSAARFVRKLSAHRAATYQSSNRMGPMPIVLVVVHSPVWLERYKLQLHHVSLGILVRFARLSDVVRDPLGSIWRHAGGDEMHTLHSISALRNGSAGDATKTAATTGVCAPAAARIPTVSSAP